MIAKSKKRIKKGGISFKDLPSELVTKISSYKNIKVKDVKNFHEVNTSQFFDNHKCYTLSQNLKGKGFQNFMEICKKLPSKYIISFAESIEKGFFDMNSIILNDNLLFFEYILKNHYKIKMKFVFDSLVGPPTTTFLNYDNSFNKELAAVYIVRILLKYWNKLKDSVKYLEVLNSEKKFETFNDSYSQELLRNTQEVNNLTALKYLLKKRVTPDIFTILFIVMRNPDALETILKENINNDLIFNNQRLFGILNTDFKNEYKGNTLRSLEIMLKYGMNPNNGFLVVSTERRLIPQIDLLLKYKADPTATHTRYFLPDSAVTAAINNKDLKILKLFAKRGPKNGDQNPGIFNDINSIIQQLSSENVSNVITNHINFIKFNGNKTKLSNTLKTTGKITAVLAGTGVIGYGAYKLGKKFIKDRNNLAKLKNISKIASRKRKI